MLLINLLIGLLISLFFYNFREGMAVGSVMFPTSYRGTTEIEHDPIGTKEKTDIFTQSDTDVKSKKDKRVYSDVRGQHWYEKKKDVDEKKDVDILHRLPLVRNTASIADCNKKKREIFQTHVGTQTLKDSVEHLSNFMNGLIEKVRTNIDNTKEIANNNIKVTQKISASMEDLNSQLEQIKEQGGNIIRPVDDVPARMLTPSAPPLRPPLRRQRGQRHLAVGSTLL